MDRTESAFGREVLYDRIRRLSEDRASLLEFDRTVERLGRDEEVRHAVQIGCAAIGEQSPQVAWQLMLDPPEALPNWEFLLPLLSLVLAVLIALTIVNPAWMPELVAVICFGLFLRAKIGWRIVAVVRPLRAAGQLTRAAASIAAIDSPLWGADTLRSASGALGRLSRIAAWLGRDQGSGDLGSVVLDYLNLLLGLDGLALVLAHAEVRRRRAQLRAVAEIVGELDAAIAVASVRVESSHWVKPTLADAVDDLVVDHLRHPLVPGCVPNSIRVADGEGMLLTGANMTGKSTFLRVVGTNVVLAQTVYTTFATRYRAPWLRVRSCISPSDDLLAAKSLHQREAETVVRILADTRSGGPMLCLFDELFRGTNADDRLGATAALVRHLLPRNGRRSENGRETAHIFLLAATHDLELLPLLADRTRAFHFGDAVTKHGLEFDYRLQAGPTSSRNAIAFLEFLGAPRSVVEEASAFARRVSSPIV